MQIEKDQAYFFRIRYCRTLGSPVALVVENDIGNIDKDYGKWRSEEEAEIKRKITRPALVMPT
jgi:hypothetical protein